MVKNSDILKLFSYRPLYKSVINIIIQYQNVSDGQTDGPTDGTDRQICYILYRFATIHLEFNKRHFVARVLFDYV